MRELRELGYDVLRTSGSHGALDVMAWNASGTRYVQCKTFLTKHGNYRDDIQKLLDIPLPPYASAELWVRQIGKRGWTLKHTVAARVDAGPPIMYPVMWAPPD